MLVLMGLKVKKDTKMMMSAGQKAKVKVIIT